MTRPSWPTVRREVFGSWPPSAWRDGVDAGRAVDVYQLLCSYQSWEIATAERGWSPDQVEEFWVATLTELLLA